MRAAVLAAVVLFTLTATVTHAEQACPPGYLDQRDMAGVYVDPASPMRVEMFACNGVTILWDNPHGRHMAYYTSQIRLPGEGVIAHGFRPDPRVGYLDNAYTIGLKPGTPGTLEVFTVSPYGEFIAMYRLRKVAL